MKTIKSNKIIIALLMFILFIVLIQWTVRFEFLQLEDMKLLSILILATAILILLGTENLKDWHDLSNKIRFNLFVTGMLMSLMLVFNLLVIGSVSLRVESFILCLKPMIFCLIVYLPIVNILKRLEQSPVNGNNDFTQLKNLSRRETEVYEWVLKGLSNKEISINLYIAESTVKKHMQNILKKTSCDDRHMLISKYNNNIKEMYF